MKIKINKKPEENIYEIIKAEAINYIPTKRWEDYNPAQNINTIEFTTRYGKVYNKVYGNTRAGKIISNLPTYNFGSIADYIVDTIPKTYTHIKSIEKFEINETGKYYNGMSIISRRFICNILNFWARVLNIPYKYAIKMWAIKEKQLTSHKHYEKVITNRGIRYKLIKDKPEYREYYLISGQEAILMLKDILYLMRNKTPEKLIKHAEEGKISSQLHNVIYGILNDIIDTKKEKQERFEKIKERLYYIIQAHDKVWSFPIINPEYIISLIKELQSGKYYLDIYVPVIHQLKKYPIECKDTHVKPLTNEQHEQNKDDYDIGKYIWADYD